MNTNENFPHPDQLVSTRQLFNYTELTVRFWERRRMSGDTPPYIYISKRAVRYRWGDVVEWLNKRMRNNTADIGGK
jgi:predicted DNA-binding transcriptional regulator AlpA